MNIPNAFQVPDFETLLAEYKQHAIDYLTQKDSDKAAEVAEAFANESELLAQITQAFVLKRIAEIREQNYWALQMFRKFVTDSDMVDLLALQYNLKRQVLEPADDSVFPPVPAVMESDNDLLRRFDLAPYQFHTTGTRMGYKFHALTLDERPTITLTTEPHALVMRYDFPNLTRPMPVRDAVAKTLIPHSGQVHIAVLSRESPDGTASDALLNRVSGYLNRDDIAQESDELIVQSARAKPYRIEATLITGGDPLHAVSPNEAKAAAQAFADSVQQLGGFVDRLKLGDVLYSLSPKRVILQNPADDIECEWDEAPYCTEIVIHVQVA
ncbi:baseplate J/gp47 family protein [Photobacterium sp. TLY01]|uniref:baseplate J/gp47 family protein n=1 Tax=Photobacterium sp. TLY01 TaxID=2907534 RepID=UPI001F36B4B4|nr:baseplate J/gp47 family protein [Photobacterium sp. TLY01]UIP28891.1 baseplate J/gp47 family protein [Photobacterium sp. TLY01]